MSVDSGVDMLTVLIGNDDFEIESICSEIKQTVLPEELKDINTTILDGATINFQDLISHCNTIPFMSNLRLVIVNDFASVIFGTSQSSTKSNSDKSDLSVVKEFLDSVPDTTHLVMVDDNSLEILIKYHNIPSVTVSLVGFVPKPDTPFQWFGQNTEEELLRKIYLLRDAAKKVKGLKLKWHDSRATVVEGILSRGDRRLAPVLEKVWKMGGVFQEWS